MLKMTDTVKNMLKELTGQEGDYDGAFNIRTDGQSAGRQSTAAIRIEPKPNGAGLDIHIAPGTHRDKVHIPVVMTESGLKEVVYNDFHIGEGADVTIVAGCGIHNCGARDSDHDGIIDRDIEQTIQNLGRVGSVGMEQTDEVILDIMVCK